MDRRMPPAIAEENVTVVVKWFNVTKGFGFVTNPERGPDIFLHASVVSMAGNPDLPEGSTLTVDLMETQRGLQVASIHTVDSSTGIRRAPSQAEPIDGEDAASLGDPVDGKIKFFDANKGYGFVAIDTGGADVFISARTMERCGVMSVENEQRVRVRTRMGDKGPMAESIEVV